MKRTSSENIALLCDLCRAAEQAQAEATLEMEAGVDDGLTPPDVTRRLVGAVETRYPGKLALWAPGLGTKHGLSDSGYPAFSPEAVATQRDLALELTGRPIGIALHGSSDLAESSLREAVAAGVVKVNWSSESLLIRSGAAREYYALNVDKLQSGSADFKATAMDNGVQAFVSSRYISSVMERISVLGGVGKRG